MSRSSFCIPSCLWSTSWRRMPEVTACFGEEGHKSAKKQQWVKIITGKNGEKTIKEWKENAATSDTLRGSGAHQKNPCATCSLSAFFSTSLKDITAQWDLSTGLCPWQDSTQQVVSRGHEHASLHQQSGSATCERCVDEGNPAKKRIQRGTKNVMKEKSWCWRHIMSLRSEGSSHWSNFHGWVMGLCFFRLSNTQCTNLSFTHNLCFAVSADDTVAQRALAHESTSTLQLNC